MVVKREVLGGWEGCNGGERGSSAETFLEREGLQTEGEGAGC